MPTATSPRSATDWPGNRGNRDMTYDGLDRLTATTSPMFGTGAVYAYDVLDNLDAGQDGGHAAGSCLRPLLLL